MAKRHTVVEARNTEKKHPITINNTQDGGGPHNPPWLPRTQQQWSESPFVQLPLPNPRAPSWEWNLKHTGPWRTFQIQIIVGSGVLWFTHYTTQTLLNITGYSTNVNNCNVSVKIFKNWVHLCLEGNKGEHKGNHIWITHITQHLKVYNPITF